MISCFVVASLLLVIADAFDLHLGRSRTTRRRHAPPTRDQTRTQTGTNRSAPVTSGTWPDPIGPFSRRVAAADTSPAAASSGSTEEAAMTATTTGTTCVLGHPWNDGQVLCPSCGFGPRAARAAGERGLPVPSAPAAGGTRVLDDRPRSDDGYWVWNGTAWEPVAAQLAPLVPAQAPSREPTGPSAPGPRRALGLRRPTPKVLAAAAAAAVLVVVAGGGAYALGLFGGSASTPAPVVSGHPRNAAAPVVQGGPLTAADVQVRAYVGRYAAAEATWRAAHSTYSDQLTVANKPAQQAFSAVVSGAGTTAVSYCVIDTAGSAGAHWFVASSRHGGLLSTAYATSAAASKACL